MAKPKELTEQELKRVSGGNPYVTLGRGYTAEYMADGRIRVLNANTHKFKIFQNSEDYEAWLNNGGKSELE